MVARKQTKGPQRPAKTKGGGSRVSAAHPLVHHDLEPHVHEALRVAMALVDGGEVGAGDLLRSAAWVGRSAKSKAFSQLLELVPLLEKQVSTPPSLPRDLDGLRLSPALDKAYAAVLPYLKKERIWGRDYVTLALLAKDDSSLQRLVAESGETLESLRARWFEFVVGSDTHRTRSEWEAWWSASGVTPPGASPSTPDASTPSATSAVYLFTWNPDRFDWEELEQLADTIVEQGSAVANWSTGARRRLAVGDRVYLMRQGKSSRGLVGRGLVDGPVRQAPHWDPAERAKGRKSWIAPVRWSSLAREPLLKLEELESQLGEADLWKSQGGGVAIPAAVAERLESIWPAAVPAAFRPADIARLDADSVYADAVDHLDVEREAHAFARVAASRDVIPPLSIGVFGEWGSGKTFFMEKIHAHIERLQRTATEAVDAGEPCAYHTAVVQIRFNAWHYMETNLWASLVDHIFRELDKWLLPKEEANEIDALFERLSTARTLRLEAVERLIEARRRRLEAEDILDRARRDLAALESERESVTAADFWRAVTNALPVALGPGERERLRRAADDLGFNDVAGSAKELMGALSRARDKSLRGELMLRAVIRRLGDWRWVAALALALVAVPWLTATLLGSEWFAVRVTRFEAGGVALSSALATLAGWVGSATALATRALDSLGAFKNTLDQSLKSRAEPDPVLQAEQLMAKRRQAVALEEQNLQRANAQVERARDEFGDSARGRLNRFIRDKITNGDYARHLGIIATIRKDFEQLAQIMADVGAQERQRQLTEDHRREELAYQERLKALNLNECERDGLLSKEERAVLVQEDRPSDEELRFFQRIVLYIDDLDRCPPDKVVEVLQACHLLLSFPLFVVVVAVDARWVSRALLTRYKGLLNGAGAVESGDETAAGDSASPRDYLEKIFQIPYWVRRMHDTNSQDYAVELVGNVADEVEKPGSDADAETPPPPEEEGAAAPVEDGEDTVTAADSGPETDAGEDVVPAGGGEASSGANEAQKPKQIDPNPQSLLLTRSERDLVRDLAPCAGQSPRTIKRFVNVYRILRTGLSGATLSSLVGPDGESKVYRALLVQLAIVTGAPTLADAYFEELAALDLNAPKPVERLLGELASRSTTADAAERVALEGALRLLVSIEDSADMVESLREYAPVVRRYSFSGRSYL